MIKAKSGDPETPVLCQCKVNRLALQSACRRLLIRLENENGPSEQSLFFSFRKDTLQMRISHSTEVVEAEVTSAGEALVPIQSFSAMNETLRFYRKKGISICVSNGFLQIERMIFRPAQE